MSGFRYNKKDLKNGWDLPPNEKIPLTGRKQRLLRAYELLIVKSDEEYMKERCQDAPFVAEQPIQPSVSEDLFRPKSEPKPESETTPKPEPEVAAEKNPWSPWMPEDSFKPENEEPIVTETAADIPDNMDEEQEKEEEIHAEVISFRPPGQGPEPEPVLEKPVRSEPEEPQIPERLSVSSFRPPGQ